MKLAEVSFPKLGPRSMLSFVVLITLILGGNALLLWQFYIASLQMGRLNGANQQVIAVLRLQGSLLSLHQRLDALERTKKAYTLATDSDLLRETLLEQIKRIRSDLAHLPSETRVDPALMPTLDAIEATTQSQLRDIAELARLNDSVAMRLRLASELTPLEAYTSALVKSTDEEVSAELAQTVERMRMVQRRILVLVPTMAISTFLIAGFFGWATARRMMALGLEERVAERTRIARELHDTLLQTLHGLLFRFQAARNLFPSRPEEAMEALEGAIARTEQAIAESQDAITDLRPAAGDCSDLGALLMATGKELETSEANGTAAAFTFTVEGERQALSPTLQDEVYRIGCELLRNAFRHACARRVEAEVRYDDEQLLVRICDDGKGMDPDVLKKGKRQGHWGLPGVKERALRIGAQLDFWSESGAGTEAQLSVPATIAYKNSHDRTRFRLFARRDHEQRF